MRQHEHSVQRLERNVAEPAQSTDTFKVSQAIKFVPKFSRDEDVTAFLQNFEKPMLAPNFPKSEWTKLIHTHLTGKAQKVFAELSVVSCMLKTALLLSYARVPEFHRKRFRTLWYIRFIT